MGNDKPMRLVLIGQPGAGKGTQAAFIVERWGIPHVSTGDMLRDEMRKGSPLGEEARGFINQGFLVPDELIFGMLKERLTRPDTGRGFVLDGFPRSQGQAVALDEYLERTEQPLTAVIVLVINDDIIVQRLSNRRVCPECARTYHLINNPPRTADRCDEYKCRQTLVQRPDDKESAIRTRLQVFHSQTAPVIEYYRQQGLLHEVQANQEILRVQIEIERILEGRPATRR